MYEIDKYRIYPAIRRGFCSSRMTSNNYISPMKFCNNTNFTLPKQSQRSRSVLQDRSRSLRLFWKEKTLSYNRINTVLSLSGTLSIIFFYSLTCFLPVLKASINSGGTSFGVAEAASLGSSTGRWFRPGI